MFGHCTTIRKMAAIEVRELCRTYQVFRKREGVWASVRGLFHREYDIVSAVRNVSFTIEEGEMVAFLGPNGAGKTTTLKLLSGLVVPTSGTAQVLGHVPWKREDAYRRRFSLVTGQKEQLWWDLPAQESFRLHKEIYRIPADDYRRLRRIRPLPRSEERPRRQRSGRGTARRRAAGARRATATEPEPGRPVLLGRGGGGQAARPAVQRLREASASAPAIRARATRRGASSDRLDSCANASGRAGASRACST